MSSRVIRRGIWVLIAVVVTGAVAVALLPAVASTQLVRDRIAQELSMLSGYRVTLGSAPRIDVWPRFSAILDEVSFTPWDGSGRPPALTAERVVVELSAMTALRGAVAFTHMRFVRPVIRLAHPQSAERQPETPSGGRLHSALVTARRAVAADSTRPDLSQLPSDALGTVEFTDGRIMAMRDGAAVDVVSSLNGKLAWPALNRSLSVSASGIWRGEPFQLDVSSAQPMILAAGGTAPLSVALKSPPLIASFDGNASLAAKGYVDGRISLASPSLARTLEWSHADISHTAALGSASLAGRINGSAERIKVDQAQVSIAGNPATGLIELSLTGPVPAVAGTLAFANVDINALAAAFTHPSPDGGQMEIDTSFADRLALDLRLSASSATSGKLTLTDVAATAQVKDGLAVLDISDAEAFGGSIQTGIRIDGGDDGGQFEVRVLATDIDGAAVSSTLDWAKVVPRARGSMSIILRGRGSSLASILNRADGSFTAKFGPGVIAGIDLPAFLARLQEGEFFAFADVARGSLPIEGADFRAVMAKGIARVEKADILANGRLLSLSGIVPYPGRGLALSGTILPQAQAATALTSEHPMFFVGGSWSAPFISPIQPSFPAE
jgi:AsmA protein